MRLNEQDGVLPPDQLWLENQIQLLEAEMDMAHQQLPSGPREQLIRGQKMTQRLLKKLD